MNRNTAVRRRGLFLSSVLLCSTKYHGGVFCYTTLGSSRRLLRFFASPLSPLCHVSLILSQTHKLPQARRPFSVSLSHTQPHSLTRSHTVSPVRALPSLAQTPCLSVCSPSPPLSSLFISTGRRISAAMSCGTSTGESRDKRQTHQSVALGGVRFEKVVRVAFGCRRLAIFCGMEKGLYIKIDERRHTFFSLPELLFVSDCLCTFVVSIALLYVLIRVALSVLISAPMSVR